MAQVQEPVHVWIKLLAAKLMPRWRGLGRAEACRGASQARATCRWPLAEVAARPPAQQVCDPALRVKLATLLNRICAQPIRQRASG